GAQVVLEVQMIPPPGYLDLRGRTRLELRVIAGVAQKPRRVAPLMVSAGRHRARILERVALRRAAPAAGPFAPFDVVQELELEIGRRALPVREVVPHLRLVQAGLEAGGVRATAGQHERSGGLVGGG